MVHFARRVHILVVHSCGVFQAAPNRDSPAPGVPQSPGALRPYNRLAVGSSCTEGSGLPSPSNGPSALRLLKLRMLRTASLSVNWTLNVSATLQPSILLSSGGVFGPSDT